MAGEPVPPAVQGGSDPALRESSTEAPPPQARQPGKWRAIVPIVIIVAFLAVVLWAVRDNQSADDLAVGTCFDIPTATQVSTVTRHECTEAHDAEVFHNAEYTGDASSYPISLTFEGFASDTCGPVFATYVGEALEDSDLTIGFFYPTRDSWGDGDRTVTCYAVRVDGSKLTQSVMASAS